MDLCSKKIFCMFTDFFACSYQNLIFTHRKAPFLYPVFDLNFFFRFDVKGGYKISRIFRDFKQDFKRDFLRRNQIKITLVKKVIKYFIEKE